MGAGMLSEWLQERGWSREPTKELELPDDFDQAVETLMLRDLALGVGMAPPQMWIHPIHGRHSVEAAVRIESAVVEQSNADEVLQ